jgi:hypothetical protein
MPGDICFLCDFVEERVLGEIYWDLNEAMVHVIGLREGF